MKISEDVSLNAKDYANQGNSIIGMRGSGKSFCAGKVAELLMDAGIPLVAFDPTGVWQNLRNGINGNKGYPVVVAGGAEADIPLTRDNAVQIMRACLEGGVSVIFDLTGKETSSKASWMHIVATVIEFLLEQNGRYGLRHVFIEEAAEFAPQRPNPGGQLVYSHIERLARMGRNFGLGYTLINQRAEEIAKAVFEISEMVIVFRQSGKNSLKSIGVWLEIRGEDTKKIMDTLPRLEAGECWLISDKMEIKVKVLPKNTFHPDPKSQKVTMPAGTKVADTKSFIEMINNAISADQHDKSSKTKKVISVPNFHTERVKLQEELKQFQEEVRQLRERNKNLELSLKESFQQFDAIAKILEKRYAGTVSISENNFEKSIATTVTKVAASINSQTGEKLQKCPLAILIFLATFSGRSFTNAQIGISTGYSPGSGGFNNALSKLNSLGLIIRNAGRISVNGAADYLQWTGPFEKIEYSLHTFQDKLSKCEREIYEVLLANPRKQFDKEDLAGNTPSDYSPGSGGFNNALSRLKTLELITRDNGVIRLNPELLELSS